MQIPEIAGKFSKTLRSGDLDRLRLNLSCSLRKNNIPVIIGRFCHSSPALNSLIAAQFIHKQATEQNDDEAGNFDKLVRKEVHCKAVHARLLFSVLTYVAMLIKMIIK